MKDLLIKYKSLISYGIFGVLTTIVNIVVYYLSSHILSFNVSISTILAWFFSVLFAYLTNRKYVFNSSNTNILKELLSFYLCRLLTGLLDWGIMLVFVEVLHFNDMYIKVLSNIIVIIINYIASKLLIFNKGKA